MGCGGSLTDEEIVHLLSPAYEDIHCCVHKAHGNNVGTENFSTTTMSDMNDKVCMVEVVCFTPHTTSPRSWIL